MTPTCCTDHCDHNQIMVGLNNKINEEESLSEFSWELGNRIFFSVHIFAKLGKWNVTSHYQFSLRHLIFTRHGIHAVASIIEIYCLVFRKFTQ